MILVGQRIKQVCSLLISFRLPYVRRFLPTSRQVFQVYRIICLSHAFVFCDFLLTNPWGLQFDPNSFLLASCCIVSLYWVSTITVVILVEDLCFRHTKVFYYCCVMLLATCISSDMGKSISNLLATVIEHLHMSRIDILREMELWLNER